MATKKTRRQIKNPHFRKEIADVTPLKHDKIEPFRKRIRPQPLLNRRLQFEEPEQVRLDPVPEFDVKADEQLYFSRPGVQHRLMRDLARGRMTIGAELDLHGLSVNQAREELVRFLADCHRRRIRSVRIVHGKGYGSATDQPVLKRKVNVWLRQRLDVLGFCSAHRRDGGTGAIYAILAGKSHRNSVESKKN